MDKKDTQAALIKLQRYGLIAFHASLVTLSATLIYGCFRLWPFLIDRGQSSWVILLTIIAASAAALSNGLASYRYFQSARAGEKTINHDYIALTLALLMVMAATSLFTDF